MLLRPSRADPVFAERRDGTPLYRWWESCLRRFVSSAASALGAKECPPLPFAAAGPVPATAAVASFGPTTMIETAANIRQRRDPSEWCRTPRPADLVPGQVDTNGAADFFLFERATGKTTLVSHIAGNPLATDDNGSSGGATASRVGTSATCSSMRERRESSRWFPLSLNALVAIWVIRLTTPVARV